MCVRGRACRSVRAVWVRGQEKRRWRGSPSIVLYIVDGSGGGFFGSLLPTKKKAPSQRLWRYVSDVRRGIDGLFIVLQLPPVPLGLPLRPFPLFLLGLFFVSFPVQVGFSVSLCFGFESLRGESAALRHR